MGAVDVGDPVAERLVDGVLEGAAAGLHGDDLGAEHPHAGDVERLALGVDLAHVDGAFEAEEGAGGGGGDAVLARAGLGDDAGLAHALGEQRLAQHVVDLVGAGVVEVLALEEDAGAARVFGEAPHLGQGAGAPGVVDHQVAQLGGEGGVRLRLLVLGGDLVDGGDEGLGDELAAERAEVAGCVRHPAFGVGNEEFGGHGRISSMTDERKRCYRCPFRRHRRPLTCPGSQPMWYRTRRPRTRRAGARQPRGRHPRARPA
ncbi:hypothetical protein GCM10020000_60450 [Streptomyces olivoverticillatus]